MTKPIKRADRWLKNIARTYIWGNEKATRVPEKVARELVRRNLAEPNVGDVHRDAGFEPLIPTARGLVLAARLGLRAPRKEH